MSCLAVPPPGPVLPQRQIEKKTRKPWKIIQDHTAVRFPTLEWSKKQSKEKKDVDEGCEFISKNIPPMQTEKINQFVVTWPKYKLNCSLPEQILLSKVTNLPDQILTFQWCPDTNTPGWTAGHAFPALRAENIHPNFFNPK